MIGQIVSHNYFRWPIFKKYEDPRYRTVSEVQRKTEEGVGEQGMKFRKVFFYVIPIFNL